VKKTEQGLGRRMRKNEEMGEEHVAGKSPR
jgi:hypothetical protein